MSGDAGTPAAPPGLRLNGTLRFGAQVLFRDIALSAPAGSWTCLLGDSGVGKSTVLRLLAGIDAGATLDGEAGADDGAALEGRIAWMAQSDLLADWLDLTGNLALGAKLRGEAPDLTRAAALLDRMGLGPHAHKTPHMLSGGMRQRAALARAIMEDRPVALLDEPFAALDLRTRAAMQDLAFAEFAGRTVLHVTHDPHEAARLGHRILVLTRAGLVEAEPPAGPPIRDAAAPEVLEAQARLTRMLLDEARA